MKKIKFVDIIIVLAVFAALVVGFLTYRHFRQTADKQIESTSKIAFQVFLRGVTITGKSNPIKPGDDTFISIRNVPYTSLKVVDSKIDTKKVVVPNFANPQRPFVLVEDYSQFCMYDIIVTIVDTAKITKDGAVVGGNKIKIGLPITLEGKDYKFNGTVSDILIEQNGQDSSSVNNQQIVPAQKEQTGEQPTAPSESGKPLANTTQSEKKKLEK